MSNIKFNMMLIIVFVSIFTTSNFTLVFAKNDNKKDAKFYADLGYSLYARDKCDKAIILYKKAIQLDPANPLYYVGLANTYSNEKAYNKAIEEFQKLNKIDNSGHIGLGLLYTEMNRYDDAIKEFKIAIKLYDKKILEERKTDLGSMDRMLQGKIYEKLADVYSRKGYFVKAEEAKNKANELKNEVDEYIRGMDKGRKMINRYWAIKNYLREVFQGGGIILSFVLLASFLQRNRKKKVGEITFKVKWGIKDIILLFILIIVVPNTIVFFYYLAYPLKYIDESIRTFIMEIFMILLVTFWVKGKYNQSLQEIGLKAESWLKNVMIGGLAIIVLYSILTGFYLGTSEIFGDYLSETPSFGIGDEFNRITSFKSIWLLFILVTLIVPFAEELFFRGFVCSGLRNRIGVKWTIVLSALFFASVHINIISFLLTFLLGILFAWLYEKRKSLIPCISAHITFNLIWALFQYYHAEIMCLFVTNNL